MGFPLCAVCQSFIFLTTHYFYFCFLFFSLVLFSDADDFYYVAPMKGDLNLYSSDFFSFAIYEPNPIVAQGF